MSHPVRSKPHRSHVPPFISLVFRFSWPFPLAPLYSPILRSAPPFIQNQSPNSSIQSALRDPRKKNVLLGLFVFLRFSFGALFLNMAGPFTRSLRFPARRTKVVDRTEDRRWMGKGSKGQGQGEGEAEAEVDDTGYGLMISSQGKKHTTC